MREITDNKGLIYEFGRFVLDAHERVLLADGQPIHLADKVFDTLLVLIQNNGKLLTKDEMMTSIWDEAFVEEGNLAKNVSRLRKVLNSDDAEMIETLPRRGYRFRADVRQIDSGTALLLHRRMRVRVTQTIGDENESEAHPDPGLLNNVRDIAGRTFLELDNGGDGAEWEQPDVIKTLPPGAARTASIRARLLGALALCVIAASALVYYFSLTDNRVEADGITNLTKHVADDNMPAWSPDGTKIAFISNRDGAEEVYVMNASGANVTRLTFSSAVEYTAAWSPDGSKIIFDSERDGNRELYSMNADGSDQTRLTFNPSSDAGLVSFSPDGRQMVFARSSSTERSAKYNYDIFVMNADGSGQKQLTSDPKFDAEPIWSPDGKTILFISDRDRNFEIYSINPDGTGEANVSRGPANDYFIAWTPDGRNLICMGDSEKPEFNQIYLLNPDGTHPRQITSFAEKVHRVSYSPSSRKFAIISRRDGNYEIYLMDASNLLNSVS